MTNLEKAFIEFCITLVLPLIFLSYLYFKTVTNPTTDKKKASKLISHQPALLRYYIYANRNKKVEQYKIQLKKQRKLEQEQLKVSNLHKKRPSHHTKSLKPNNVIYLIDYKKAK